MLVEDACQAHGALLGGRRAGSIGDAGCFSFYPAKNLGAWGDGGAVVTDDGQLAERIRLMRSHGELTRYHHELPGTTARLDALQAAILRVKLRRLEDWNASRRRVAGALTDALQDSPVITPAPVQDGMDHVYHQFVVQSESRDALRSHLAAAGVPSAIHYPVPIHRTRAYAQIHAGRAPLPVTEGLAERIVSLPMHPMLSEAEIAQIGAAVRSFER